VISQITYTTGAKCTDIQYTYRASRFIINFMTSHEHNTYICMMTLDKQVSKFNFRLATYIA